MFLVNRAVKPVDVGWCVVHCFGLRLGRKLAYQHENKRMIDSF